MHIKVCIGFPKDDTPLSSDLEPKLPGSQESPHHSKCPKQMTSDSTKESDSHPKSHRKLHKKSKYQKVDTPKKERWDKDKADKQKSEKSCRK